MLLQGLGTSDGLSLLSIQSTLTGNDDGDVANRASLSRTTVTDLHQASLSQTTVTNRPSPEALEEVLESHHSQNGLHQCCQPTQLGPASQDKLTTGCICVLEETVVNTRGQRRTWAHWVKPWRTNEQHIPLQGIGPRVGHGDPDSGHQDQPVQKPTTATSSESKHSVQHP